MGLGGVGPWSVPPRDPQSEIERIRGTVARFFPVYETRITPASLILLVHADPSTLETKFDSLRQEMWGQYYVPQIRHVGGEYLIEVVRRPARSPWGAAFNAVLLVLTIITTATAGALLWLSYVGGSTLAPVDFLYGGLEFALPLMTILGCHELAHFVMARRHHVEASLPFFLPVPPPFILFGTFGAFISLREPIPDRKTLLDIGASGPLAGFAVALPVTLFGLALSAHAPALSVANCGPSLFGIGLGQFAIGPSVIWAGLGLFFPVATLANLSPVAIAGWVGLLVTAINLLPAGQLDGGHVFRALLGPRASWASYAAVALLFLLGVLFYEGWLLFAVLIFLLGLRHPPPLNDLTGLDGKRIAVGVLAAAILVAGFVAVPISPPSNNFTTIGGSSAPVNGTLALPHANEVSIAVDDQDLFAHAYVVSGVITGVVASVNNSTEQLTGSALQAFLANSSWTVSLPGANTSTFAGAGTFAIPGPGYFALAAGATGSVSVEFASAQEAVIELELTVSELCTGSPPVEHALSFTLG